MDRREKILLKEFDVGSEDCQTWAEDIQLAITLNPDVSKIKNAMDENGKCLCLELLKYMAKYHIKCSMTHGKDPVFMYGNTFLTKEQLFENFL